MPSGATSGGVIVTVSNIASDDAPFTVTGSAPSTSDVYYYFSDALGTARVITGSDGTVCYDADLYPYGGIRTYNSTCGPTQVFTTYERDPESNNDYAMARYFSSRLGRFMSPDPTGIFLGNLNDPQSLNLYSYVGNNPSSLTDPSGLGIGISVCVGDCGDDGGDGGFGFGFGFGGGGGGGDWSWDAGPSGPSYFPANVGTNPNPPNGTLASDDPFGGETNGIPNGIGIPYSLPGLLMPGSVGCDYAFCSSFTSPGGLTVSPFAIQVNGWISLFRARTQGASDREKCVKAAYARALDNASRDSIQTAALPLRGTLSGAIAGAVIGCVTTAAGGCVEGAMPGALTGALGGFLEGSVDALLRNISSDIRVSRQLKLDLAACGH